MGVLNYFSEGMDLSPSPVLGPTLEGDLWGPDYCLRGRT